MFRLLAQRAAFTVSGNNSRLSAAAATAVRAFSSSVKTGRVKWFDSKKGFGFILPDDAGDEDVFVHQTSVHAEGYRSLADGEPVEYTIVVDQRGRVKADRVTGPMGAYVQGAPRRTFAQYGDMDHNAMAFGGAAGAAGGFAGPRSSERDVHHSDLPDLDELVEETEREFADELKPEAYEDHETIDILDPNLPGQDDENKDSFK